MNKKIAFISLFLILIVTYLGILVYNGTIPTPNTPSTTPTQSANDTGATLEGVHTIIEANNKFALDFYSNIKNENEGENIFFSPYSISTALMMTYEGARNETAEEIQSVFYFPKEDFLRRSSAAAVYNRLNKNGDAYELSTANALWIQKDYQLLPQYVSAVEDYYGGKTANVDFVGNTEGARKTINSWVEDKTNDKIKDLFPKGSLNQLTRLVLTNAVYFKGNWVKQFEKDKTTSQEFRVNEGKKVEVPMMRRTGNDAKFNYTETEDLQLLEMFYEGEKLSMLVLLPKYEDLEKVEGMLTVENLSEWRAKLVEQRVDVFIPKFTFDSKYTLNETLKKMGMPLAFEPPSETKGADFTGINEDKKLYIQLVIHQAFVDVNEEGTEAAAATGVSIGFKSVALPSVPIFRADHPFIFLIQDHETGNILFMGTVMDPTV